MTNRKYNKVKALSSTARYPQTFAARLKNIPGTLIDKLTAQQIAEMIDIPMQASYQAGIAAGIATAQRDA